MGYCVDHAIPYSVWLEDWSTEDRARVIAYLMEKAERCNLCGTAEWEWLEDRYAYEAVRHICFGCQQKDLAREEEDGAQAGLSIVLITGAQAARIRAQQRTRE